MPVPAMVAAVMTLLYIAVIPVHIVFRLQTDAEKIFRIGISIFRPNLALKPARHKNKNFKPPKVLHPPDALSAAKTALRRIKIEQICLDGEFGSGDAASTALICGGISAISCMFSKRTALRLTPDFSADRLRIDLTGMISMRFGHIMTAALLGAFQYGLRRFKAWTSIPLKAL